MEFRITRSTTVLLTDTCSNADSSSGNELQCSDECMKAVTNNTNNREELGCCVAYWRGGVGGSGDEGPTVEEIFSACGVEIPSACSSFSPPSEFLDCARDPGVVGADSVALRVSLGSAVVTALATTMTTF